MSSINKYQALITKLEENDPNLIHLNFEDIDLTILQLEEIASKIQNNDFIGNVSWGGGKCLILPVILYKKLKVNHFK